jgi:hypothetical protein
MLDMSFAENAGPGTYAQLLHPGRPEILVSGGMCQRLSPGELHHGLPKPRADKSRYTSYTDE